MRTITSMAVGLAVAGLATVLTTGHAWADDTAPTSSSVPANGSTENAVTPQNLTAFDGYFYAAEHPNGVGKYCRWAGDDNNWDDCKSGDGSTVNMLDQASQMFNNGIPGGADDVKVFYSRLYRGAWRCLANGNHWDNLSLGYQTFNGGGSSAAGYGQSLNDNVASHNWVTSC
ncbi:hypothetical protein [Nonomuraea sp. NPDC001699]